MAFTLAFFVKKGVNPKVANAKRDQDLTFSTDVFQLFTDQPFGFTAGDLAVEAGVLDVVRGPVQGGNVTGHERLPATYRDFANAVQVTNALGVQVEVSGGSIIACSRHGGTPVQQKRGYPPALAAGEFRKGEVQRKRGR
ncbi:hypothetical protein D9M71_546410 [compost metagenome]